jgi:transcriptional antiterminator
VVKTNLLRAEMAKNGLTIKDLACIMGVTERTAANKLKNGNFYVDEAFLIIKALKIKNGVQIFLSQA